MSDEVKCTNCLDHREVLKSIALLEEGQKELFHRTNILERNESKKDERIENIYAIVKELKIKLESTMIKPMQRYDTIKIVIITAFITSTIGGAIGLVFLWLKNIV